jgi:hypothetical protein
MLIFYASFLLIVIVSIILLGDDVAGEEFDIGVVFIAVIFIFIPLCLLFIVAESVFKQDPQSINTKKLTENQIKRGLLIISIVDFVMAGILFTWGVFCFTSPPIFEEFFKINTNAVIFLGIFVTLLAISALYGGVGLFLKQKSARLITTLIMSFLLVFIYPLFAALYLYQDDVRSLYENRTSAKEVKD